MSTRIYKINNEWHTYEYWHDNYGYTWYDTFTFSYKTTANWGALYPDSGYMDMNESLDIFDFTFFVPGVVGWYNLDDLATEGYYPASATDIQVSKNGAVSNAAYIEVDGNNYYLVQQDLSQGWMSEAELLARGWEFDVEITQYLYGVMDDTSEYELITIDNLPTTMMENTGYLHFHAEFIEDPNLSWVMGNTSIMEANLPTPQFFEAYLTANGSSGTSDTTCAVGTTYTLYDASGNTIPYDSTKSYLNYWSYTYSGVTVYEYFSKFETHSDTVLKGRPSANTKFYKLMMRVDAP